MTWVDPSLKEPDKHADLATPVRKDFAFFVKGSTIKGHNSLSYSKK